MAWMSPKQAHLQTTLISIYIMMCLDAPTLGSISNQGKWHFLKRDWGMWRAAIFLDSTWPTSCRFSLGLISVKGPHKLGFLRETNCNIQLYSHHNEVGLHLDFSADIDTAWRLQRGKWGKDHNQNQGTSQCPDQISSWRNNENVGHLVEGLVKLLQSCIPEYTILRTFSTSIHHFQA